MVGSPRKVLLCRTALVSTGSKLIARWSYSLLQELATQARPQLPDLAGLLPLVRLERSLALTHALLGLRLAILRLFANLGLGRLGSNRTLARRFPARGRRRRGRRRPTRRRRGLFGHGNGPDNGHGADGRRRLRPVRRVVVGNSAGHAVVERGIEVAVRAGGVDRIRDLHEAAVGGGIRGLGQTAVMQRLGGIDKDTLIREGELMGPAGLDSAPAVVATGASQGSDLQIRVGGRAALKDIVRRAVGGHIRQSIGLRKSHEIRLKVMIGERDHVDRRGQGQIRAVQQARAHVRVGAGHEIHGRGVDGHAIASGGELGSGGGLLMGVLEVGLQVVEVPVHHQIGILSYRLIVSVTAGLQGRDVSRSIRSLRRLVVHRHGPRRRWEVISRVVVQANEAVAR